MNIYTAVCGAYSHYIASDQWCRKQCSILAVAVLNLPGQGAQSRAVYSDIVADKKCSKGKQATIHTGSLAGSVSNLFECMRNAVSFGVPLDAAILAATRNPAVAIGKFDRIGSISPNKTADLLVLNQDLTLCNVIHHGVLLNN